MDRKQKAQLIGLAGEGVRFDCPMAQYTTFRVGGNVEALYEAYDLDNLERLAKFLNKEYIPYAIVGRGSNLLVKDDGIEGVAILLRGSLAVVKEGIVDDQTILAGAGMALTDFLAHCRTSGLGGAEFLAGIPGTVGGAVAMNAGAFGREIGSKVKEIHLINQGGDLVVIGRPQIKFSYRKLELEKRSLIVQVRFDLEREPEAVVAERISDYLKRRRESQPLEYPSAGSIFKNPPNDYAGRLIESTGLKGKRIGGAMISKKHANFIVNTGGAKAKDILALLRMAQERVREATGIVLEPEIQVMGK